MSRSLSTTKLPSCTISWQTGWGMACECKLGPAHPADGVDARVPYAGQTELPLRVQTRTSRESSHRVHGAAGDGGKASSIPLGTWRLLFLSRLQMSAAPPTLQPFYGPFNPRSHKRGEVPLIHARGCILRATLLWIKLLHPLLSPLPGYSFLGSPETWEFPFLPYLLPMDWFSESRDVAAFLCPGTRKLGVLLHSMVRYGTIDADQMNQNECP